MNWHRHPISHKKGTLPKQGTLSKGTFVKPRTHNYHRLQKDLSPPNAGLPKLLGKKVRGSNHLSHNQNPVLKWLTQNHVRICKGGRNYLWLGLSLTNLHLPGFDCVSFGCVFEGNLNGLWLPLVSPKKPTDTHSGKLWKSNESIHEHAQGRR